MAGLLARLPQMARAFKVQNPCVWEGGEGYMCHNAISIENPEMMSQSSQKALEISKSLW